MNPNRYKLEALAEAIAHYSGYADPGSALYIARNPGGLKAHSPLHLKDEDGNRVFLSVLDGLQALLFDVTLKMQGKAKVKLSSASTLANLAEAYGLNVTTAAAWARFLRKALRNENLSQKTAIQFFFEE